MARGNASKGIAVSCSEAEGELDPNNKSHTLNTQVNKTKATPPPRGVEMMWELRELGSSEK